MGRWRGRKCENYAVIEPPREALGSQTVVIFLMEDLFVVILVFGTKLWEGERLVFHGENTLPTEYETMGYEFLSMPLETMDISKTELIQCYGELGRFSEGLWKFCLPHQHG
ncbi:hypothetical protein ACH5RR_032806 [Cinchona calisaya]|uniref:Uncharacterized protein n=1 Tax=Cinchona calisaya TaxID=153742 RepID=A0ABD2YLK3_9GENT